MRHGRAMLVALLILIAGCDQQKWIASLSPADVQEHAKQFVALFPAGDYAAIERQLDPSQTTPDQRRALEQIARTFPPGSPDSIQLIGANTTNMVVNSVRSTTWDMTFEYAYPGGRWVLVNVVFRRGPDQAMVVWGIHARQLGDSYTHLNRFTLRDRKPTHYLFLVLAIVIPLFILTTFVLCLRTPIPRRKWAWALATLFGIGQFTLNWTDGTSNIQALGFVLLGSSMIRRGFVGPWLLSIGVPVGAVIFLARRKELKPAAKMTP